MAYIWSIMPALLAGLKTTGLIFAVTIIGALPLGVVVALGLMLPKTHLINRLISGALSVYVWLFRGTPLLLQLIFIFYGLPVVGIVFDRLTAAILAFVLNYAAYFAEIYRGGFQAVDTAQTEAAVMLNLSKWQTLRYVILPQVVAIVLPSIGNEVINLVKDSSLVYVIGIGDLLRAGNVATARDVTLLPLVAVGVVYLLMTFVLTVLQRRLEKRFAKFQ